MKKITGAMHTFGIYILAVETNCGYSKENILHRIKEGIVSSAPSKDRILCLDQEVSNETLAINREWKKLPSRQKKAVFGKYAMTKIIGEDGLILTAKQACKLLRFPSWNRFEESYTRGVKRINSKVGL